MRKSSRVKSNVVAVNGTSPSPKVEGAEDGESSPLTSSLSKCSGGSTPRRLVDDSDAVSQWDNVGETKLDDDRIVQEIEERKKVAEALKAEEDRAPKSRLQQLLCQSEKYTAILLARSLRPKSKDLPPPKSSSSSRKSTATSSGGGRKLVPRHKKSGKDDDELLDEVEEELSGHRLRTRLIKQPTMITGGILKPYQMEGLNWLINLYESGLNGILADEMGLGKTLESISLLAYLREFRSIRGPHLVLAPKSTLGNWVNEFNRFTPGFKVFKFHGNKDERRAMKDVELVPGRHDVIVTSYELCIKERATLGKFKFRYLIIDEAHRIKNDQSKLFQVSRSLRAEFRLLLTGTPLQNNLKELWALLNFLFPEMFASSDEFQSMFEFSAGAETQAEREERNQEIVSRLHRILRPFLLRRIKSEVAVELPPKKELLVLVPLSEMQRVLYRELLARNVDAVSEREGGGRLRLLNLAMQLRKACNHPYLFEGQEASGADPFGEHLVTSAGKMVLLDRLMVKLIQRGCRTLIFTQMTRVLDILEDYCRMRGFKYARIDGSTEGDDRDRQIRDFNAPGSELVVFLLSTRAGGLGINLATADTVVLYDSDWNPQVDLQALDRAHRIGQTRPVNVYRLIHEHTIEEKILERANLKLQLDSAVIQQGRLADRSRNLGRTELMNMIQYGADQIFKAGRSLESLTEEDIEAILLRGEERASELTAKLSSHVKRSVLDFTISSGPSASTTNHLVELFDEGVDYDPTQKQADRQAWAQIGVSALEEERTQKRRVRVAQEEMERAMRQRQKELAAARQMHSKQSKLPPMQDWQFYNREKIQSLHDEEVRLLAQQASMVDDDDPTAAYMGDAEIDHQLVKVRTEKAQLLSDGFGSWSRKDFLAFVRGSELYGRDRFDLICRELEGTKTRDEVSQFAGVFWDRWKTLTDGERLVARIAAGEVTLQKRCELESLVQRRQSLVGNCWAQLSLGNLGPASSRKLFSEREDRWLANLLPVVGHGNWTAFKIHATHDNFMRRDWHIRSRTGPEIGRRVERLLRQMKKEEEAEKKEVDELLSSTVKPQTTRKRTARGAGDGSSATPSTEGRSRKVAKPNDASNSEEDHNQTNGDSQVIGAEEEVKELLGTEMTTDLSMTQEVKSSSGVEVA